MSTQLKLRRGTTTQHSTFTGAEGEITVDTTKDTVVVHDGATAGGFPLAKESGSALSPTSVTLSSGTANGVAYLNGSKVLTTGSALTFDGTNFAVGNISPSRKFEVTAAGDVYALVETTGTTGTVGYLFGDSASDSVGRIEYVHASDVMQFTTGGSEKMRLTSTGLGIGTNSPSAKLHVLGTTQPAFQYSSGVTPLYVGQYNVTGDASVNNSAAAALVFGTSNTERMRIDSSGNVGVGTSSITAGVKLQINSTSSASDALIYTASANGAYKTGLVFEASGVNAGFFGYNNSGSTYLGVPTGAAGVSTTSTIPIVFSSSSAERMRIDSSGNVGIGTSSPNYLLSVQANSVQMGMSPQSGIGYLGNYSNAPIGFVVNNAEKMRLDTSGNLGLGVTPSAWGANYAAFEMKSGFSLTAYPSSAVATGFITSNAYFNGTNWVYKISNYATRYKVQNNDGVHSWDIAPSGTAGNAISFTQAMTLDASGNLLVGTTNSSGGKLEVGTTAFGAGVGNIVTINSSVGNVAYDALKLTNKTASVVSRGVGISFYSDNAQSMANIYAITTDSADRSKGTLHLSTYSGTVQLNAGSTNPIIFTTNAAERMRIDSSGNLGLGITPSAWVTTTTSRGIQFGRGGSVFYSTDLATSSFGGNYYQDGTNAFKYLASGYALKYSQSDFNGSHSWFTAPSGTAGNAISFTQAMTLDASGNLGVGTTAPRKKVEVVGDLLVTDVNFGLGTEGLSVANILRGTGYNSSVGQLLTLGSTNSDSVNNGVVNRWVFGLSGNATSGQALTYSTATNGGGSTLTERMRIDSSGNLLVGKTSATANGGDVQVSKGITFPATQVAASDANTLDDYEEGVWYPAYGGSTTNPTMNYNEQIGRYTKVGRLVTCYFHLRTSATSTGGGVGNLQLTGLPFVSANVSVNGGRQSGSIGSASNFGTSNFPNAITVENNAAYANLLMTSTTANTTNVDASTLTLINQGNGLAGAFSYIV